MDVPDLWVETLDGVGCEIVSVLAEVLDFGVAEVVILSEEEGEKSS